MKVRRVSRRRVLWLSSALLLLGALIGWVRCGPLPPGLFDLGSRVSLEVVDRGGRPLYESLSPAGTRSRAAEPAVWPEAVVAASLAAEDARFFLHPGIDPLALARAVWHNLRAGHIVEGIASGSNEQVHAIEHINTAVQDINKVTQQNAVNSEEAASASEEMNSQAEATKEVAIDLVGYIERRTFRRHKKRWRGLIDNRQEFTTVDISRGGACVKYNDPSLIPQNGDVVKVILKNREMTARVIGVSNLEPPEEGSLVRLKFNHSPKDVGKNLGLR